MTTKYIKMLDRVHPIDEPEIRGTVTSVTPSGRCAVDWDDGLSSNVLPVTLRIIKSEELELSKKHK